MLIINADDFGRVSEETDAALRCHRAGRITSATAMVFMADSERAAALAREEALTVGLHLNFAETFNGKNCPSKLAQAQNQLVRYLMGNKYAQLVYNPLLREQFAHSYEAQVTEFARLYGRRPTHIDGHHHMHLCANLLLSRRIPTGTKLRRNFSFWPGEKYLLNRMYRKWVDHWLARRYRLADYFFCLWRSIQEHLLDRVEALATSGNVELMTHPVHRPEAEYLMSDEFSERLQRLHTGNYTVL